METQFHRHQKVKLLVDPDPEYIEYHEENPKAESEPFISKGMIGRINMLLPNGQYHVEIIDPDKIRSGEELSEGDDDVIAYVPMDEEQLELAED